MASDKNHRPCLPLKPQEKKLTRLYIIITNNNNGYTIYRRNINRNVDFLLLSFQKIELERGHKLPCRP